MASTYTRKDSLFIWMRIKGSDGKWKSIPTSYRKDNLGDRRQAELAARRLSVEERASKPSPNREQWDYWVDQWMKDRYGSAGSTTLTTYTRYWLRWRTWLAERSISAPAQLSYLSLLLYKESRTNVDVGINTIIHELKFMGVVMGEAVRRGFVATNPCLRMGLKRSPTDGKEPWPAPAIARVGAAIGKQEDWFQATFFLGFYQAARLRQCEVPLKDIDLERPRITYWRSLSGRPLTKGNKPFTQPITKSALPLLTALIERRKAAGFESLCDIPLLPSVEWRQFLDSLDLPQLCHHGLRTTWITRAALSGKISRAEAMRFVNHGSTAVHEIYQRLNADDVAHVPDVLDLPDLSQ